MSSCFIIFMIYFIYINNSYVNFLQLYRISYFIKPANIWNISVSLFVNKLTVRLIWMIILYEWLLMNDCSI